MIDIQSLILIAVNERDFWTGERIHTIGVAPVGEQRESPRRGNARGRDDRATFYLAMCAGYRNEAPYLAEWIEFHRLVGVEHFFLYNARSTDHHREVLAPYIEDGIVTLNPDWEGISYQQADTFTECLRAHGHESRWIAFIDIDEFLFSPTGRPLPELLVEYEQWPAVAVNWALYGRSGHMTKPDGLVIENYLMRSDTPTNLFTKKIVDPSRTVRCVNGRAFDGHMFEFTSLLAVDENHYPIHGTHSKSVSFSRFRLNHYVTKSEEEARGKLGRPDEWVDSRQWRSTMVEDAYPKERDEAAARYVPGVKAALAARRVGQPSDSR
jgi:hypothetical protein